MITVEWTDEKKHIILLTFQDELADWSIYRQAVKDAYALARTQAHTVHYIYNAGDTPMPPGNPLQHMEWALHHAPANTGIMVSVVTGMKPFERRMLEALQFAAREQIVQHVVDTLDEALRLIDRV